MMQVFHNMIGIMMQGSQYDSYLAADNIRMLLFNIQLVLRFLNSNQKIIEYNIQKQYISW